MVKDTLRWCGTLNMLSGRNQEMIYSVYEETCVSLKPDIKIYLEGTYQKRAYRAPSVLFCCQTD